MEFQIEIPQEEFSDFLDEFVVQGYEDETEQAEDGQGSLIVEYDGTNLGTYLGNAGLTVAIGLIVVMAALLVLTGIFKGFGYVLSAKSRKKPAVSSGENLPVSPSVAIPAVSDLSEENNCELIAVIAAAVCAMEPQGKRYVVKKVSRVSAGGRSAWSAAGVAENTAPF